MDPPTKRARLDGTATQVLVPVHVDGAATSMQQVTIRMHVPWSPVEWWTVPRVGREISALLEVVNKVIPLQKYSMEHVKRVKSGDGPPIILIAPVEYGELPKKVVELVGSTPLSTQILPQYPPPSNAVRIEWSDRCSWPLHMVHHPPVEIVEMSSSDALIHEKFMNIAIEMALLGRDKCNVPVGAVIINANGEEIARAHGGSCTTSSRHAHRLDHACMVAIDTVSQRHMERDVKGEYLCTGCDVFVTREPCIMCSMALVHSRVKRVFYAAPNALYGGLGSRCQLQNEPSLNHHFDVFQGLGIDRCNDLNLYL